MTALAIRRFAPLTRLLLGVEVPAGTVQAHWDLSTLALARALRRSVRPGLKVLDVGTGEAAMLAVVAARLGAEVVALEVDEAAAASASAAAARNGVVLDVRRSDLLSAVRDGERFDVAVCNPPYVPSGEGARRGLTEPARVWDGGADGLLVLRRLLDEAPARLPGTLLLVGFNARHVPEARVRDEAAARALGIECALRPWWSPARVLALRVPAR